MPAKPLRLALGSLIIQKQYDYSDRELVEQLTENPYYQFFIGLPGYQQEPPFASSLLVEFRKRLTDDILGDINEMIIGFNHPDDHTPAGGSGDSGNTIAAGDGSSDNEGTLILDATCAPQNIAFPQDINLLNEAREDLERIIDTVCYEYNEPKPRTYRKKARKDYLALPSVKTVSKDYPQSDQETASIRPAGSWIHRPVFKRRKGTVHQTGIAAQCDPKGL